MSDIRITELPLAGPITGAEAIPVVQNGTTVQTTAGSLLSQGVTNASTNTLPFCMYSNNYMGTNYFGPTNNQNKFVALAASTNPANFLTFQFFGGSVNGINIPKNNPLVGSSITLTPSTVTFVDEGFGLVPSQYTDFVNSIMEGLNLVSRVVTKNTNDFPSNPPAGGAPYWNQINYCNADTYFLLFQETGAVPNSANMTTVYGFKSYNVGGGFNLWGNFNLNDFTNMAQAIAMLNDPNYNFNQFPFLQQN